MPELEVRELSEVSDLRSASELFDRIWRAERIFSVEVLRALATHGSAVLGAFRRGRMVGAQVGFLGTEGGELLLHSHVTGIEPSLQHQGVGATLKWAQRDWALARGIELVTWTFDPMIARNAYFNLRKLGGRSDRFLRDFYGPMGDVFSAGERSDRLEVSWRLRAPRVERAAAGDHGSEIAGAPALLDEEGGRPRPRAEDDRRVLVRVPSDYLELRERDPDLAGAWRDAVAEALEDAFGRGYAAVDFLRDGAYVLERT